MRTPWGRLARAAFRYHYLLPLETASALGSVFTAWRRSDRHDCLTEVAMRTLIERCCGFDVHQATIVACLLAGKPGGKVRKEIRSFATTTAGLLQLRDWLAQEGCSHVGMESTGVYWRPVYALLEDDFTLVVGNAQRIKNVPGRKTDVKDCEWIADLLRHGLIPPSFVPEQPIRALRDLMRFRRSLVDARTNCRNRIIQVLESANIKLASVATGGVLLCSRTALPQSPMTMPQGPSSAATASGSGRIWRLSNQSRVGTVPPSTSTPHWPACWARRW